MVPPLSAFFFLALGVVNAVAAEEPLNKVVGLGEACDAAAGIVCKSGLECSASKPDVAGVCANSLHPHTRPGSSAPEAPGPSVSSAWDW